VPYVDSITDLIKENFYTAGFESISSSNEHLTTNFEEGLCIPVIDNVVVAFWAALRCLSIGATVAGCGSLLSGVDIEKEKGL
jgi:maleate cis-trans isomerase